MTATAILERLGAIRIVPVVTIADADRAPDVAAALVAGGIGCAEITLRTPQGLEAIRRTASISDIVVGAGTVLTVEQVDRCVDAGAQFLVSPGFDDEVVERAQFHGVEIQRALRSGIDVVKFFPADRLGGLDTISALAAPLADVRFVPSGGVNPSNAAAYLQHPAIFAISGSWMVSRDAIAAGDYDAISELSRAAVALAADVQ
jgi:2-dehydro-3-deoxyphosphogluconate aldolase/(4S)-4-hydroxy-2-oxoglutarate aldolase